MGWCGGTEIFDYVADFILNTNIHHDWKVNILTKLAEALEKQDWDCQSDSKFYATAIVTEVFAALHPSWYSPKQLILDKIQSAKERKLYRDEKGTLDLFTEIEQLIKRE